MLRSSLCLLFTALFVSATWAQQGHTDVQSLQYEFGRGVSSQNQPVPRVTPMPYPMCVPVYVPVCIPVYTACHPCYAPCRSAVQPRRTFLRSLYVRPAYYPPYSCGCR